MENKFPFCSILIIILENTNRTLANTVNNIIGIRKENDSTNFLDDNRMKELIHTIVDVVRKNATVDWSKRDDVRAKLRLTVKKILMRYGYPPDLAKLEADRVLAQGEALAEMFSNGS